MSTTDPREGGSTEPLDTVDFAEPPPPTGGSRRGLITAVAAAVGLVASFALGTMLAGGSDTIGPAAATSSASPTADGDDPADKDGDAARPDKRGRLHGPGGMLGLGLGGAALHGTYVVEDPDGTFRTLVAQRGEITSVSATSLSVKSKDGFTATYKLEDATDLLGGPEGVGDLSKGDDVGVTAERSGGVDTATHVLDLSRLGGPFGGGPGFKHHVRPGQEPTGGATTEGTASDV